MLRVAQEEFKMAWYDGLQQAGRWRKGAALQLAVIPAGVRS